MEEIGSVIVRLKGNCDRIRSDIIKAQHENSPILEEVKSLLVQRQETERKGKLLSAFNRHFVISDEDFRILTSSAADIETRFFAALESVKRVYGDCRILLGSENQRIGLELMEQCSRILNAAYQRLFRWVQTEFKAIDFENPQINSLVRKALRTLSERPNLFQTCLESFADAREHALSNGFYTALTGSSGSNYLSQTAKPIEFSAHDPIRHVGDMLAWAHAAAVTEKEILESFFVGDGIEITRGLEAARATEPWLLVDNEPFDGHKVTLDLLSRNMAGVFRTLRQECEQIIRTQEAPVLTFDLVNIFSFYRTIFKKLLQGNSAIVDVLIALEKVALHKSEKLLHDHFTSIETDSNWAAEHLAVPEFLQESLEQLGQLIKSYTSSLTPGVERTTDSGHVLRIALDPALKVCEAMSLRLEEPAKSVFLVNCFDACQKRLTSIEFMKDDRPSLDKEIADCKSHLTDHQHAYFLHQSGMHALFAALASIPEDDEQADLQAPTLSEFQPAALQNAAQRLDDFLPSALMDASENLKDVFNRQIADEITSEAAEQFCEDFEYVENRLIAIDQSRQPKQGNDVDDNDDGGGDDDDKNYDYTIQQDHKVSIAEVEKPLLRPFYPRMGGEIRILLSS